MAGQSFASSRRGRTDVAGLQAREWRGLLRRRFEAAERTLRSVPAGDGNDPVSGNRKSCLSE